MYILQKVDHVENDLTVNEASDYYCKGTYDT